MNSKSKSFANTVGVDQIRYLPCGSAHECSSSAPLTCLFHPPQTRHTLAWWSGCVYNWVRTHRSLRHPLEQPQGKQLYQARTPAVAMELTHDIWNVADLLRCVVYPAV